MSDAEKPIRPGSFDKLRLLIPDESEEAVPEVTQKDEPAKPSSQAAKPAEVAAKTTTKDDKKTASVSKRKSTSKPADQKASNAKLDRFTIQISNKTKLFSFLEEYVENGPYSLTHQSMTQLMRSYLKDREDEFIEALERYAKGE